MKPIKFCGKMLDGSTVYGIYGTEHGRTIIADDDAVYTVEPESIEKLVGYDKNGDELYERVTEKF